MKMDFLRNIPQSSKVIGVISTCVLLVLIFPWILVVLAVSFVTGYFAVLKFDLWIDRVSPLVVKYLGVPLLPQNNSTVVDSSSKTPYDDPLQQQLYLQENITSGPPSNSNSLNCLVCSEPNCSRDDNLRHSSSLGSLPVPTSLSRSASASSTPKFEPTPYQLPKVDDLKVDPRLDISISRFCSTVFDYYVGTYWAPYETRRQLKLAMKQFLYTLGDRINKKLITNPYQTPDQFCQAKVIPLVLHYLEKVGNHLGGSESIFPPDEQTKVRFKMRKLTRLVLEQSLSEDDLRCKLWMELCIAVLADGVLWNVMALGRDHLPELLEYYVNVAKVHFSPSVASLSLETSADELQFHDANSYDETDNTSASSKKAVETFLDANPVPFLLDNFLDRKDSLEQPDPIVSRWRPTLRDIIEETELLYPLIQYLKHVGGQKVLAYLQAVLDESPDAKEYCRRVLEVEYLPGFCRSHFFHESMGLSRVEQGMEVGADHSPGSARRVKTHARSASYGSKSNPAISDFLKMDGGVVEGLPLHFDSDYGSLSANSSSSSAGSAYSSGGGASLPYSSTEPDAASVVSSASHSSSHSMFKRNKPPVEDAVTKFFNSTLSPGTGSGGHKKSSSVSATASSSSEFTLSSLSERPDESVPRVGIHAKSYDDLDDPAVNSRVLVDPQKCDLLQKVAEFASSTITGNPWLGPVLSGWLELLHPYLKPHFDSQVEDHLKNFLSIDLCVTLVDLITDAFINNGENLDDENMEDDDPKSESSDKSGSTSNKPPRHNPSPSPDIPEKSSMKKNQNQSGKEEDASKKDGTGGTKVIESPLLGSPSSDSSLNDKMRDQKIDTFLQSFLKLFISRVISLDKFLSSFSTNRDYIFLFFVDILDLLVTELYADTSASKSE